VTALFLLPLVRGEAEDSHTTVEDRQKKGLQRYPAKVTLQALHHHKE